MNRLDIFKNKKILMLQGPVGSFFKNLAITLTDDYNAEVHKINFNAGDNLFFPDGYNFNGNEKEFHRLLLTFFKKKQIDVIMLFGDCRNFHLLAKTIAEKKDIEVVSFEEGYIRPNYVTMEFKGVNGNSNIAKVNSIYDLDSEYKEETIINMNNPKQWKIASKLYLYNFMMSLLKFQYPIYKHHRNFGLREALLFSKKWTKRRLAKRKDNEIINALHLEENVFFVPLQVSTDSQILCHSDYNSITDFFVELFEKVEGKNITLVFKNHPLEIEMNYQKIIEDLSKRYTTKIHFLRTGNVHDITKVVKGVITVNSTVGLQSLFDLKPVFCFGRSIYIKKELAINKNFEDFIKNTEKYKPKEEDVLYFKDFLKNNTQLKGSFY